MGVVQVDGSGPVTNMVDLNHHMQEEHKERRDEATCEKQGPSEEDESRINEDRENVKDGRLKAVHFQGHEKYVLQKQRQQPRRQLAQWERFLPLRSLKVLLVESDDSTCRLVCELLRNCGYEVMAATNGLQAWEILVDINNQIDIVLTEVVIPGLSGLGLLNKIMSHKTCKNLPVIMMSCHDSMNIVFKCLSKGAVNFLTKPLRKNELQNIWQHVWRKCHSSSGSGCGSASGISTQKCNKAKSGEESDDSSRSSNEDDTGNIDLNIPGGSDHASGTQSSWTKRAVEVDGPKAMSSKESADPMDITCAQLIHPTAETLVNSLLPTTARRECDERDDECRSGSIIHSMEAIVGYSPEVGVSSRTPSLQLDGPNEKLQCKSAVVDKKKLSEMNSKKDNEQEEEKQLKFNSDKPDGDSRYKATEIMGVVTNSTISPIASIKLTLASDLFRKSRAEENATYNNDEIPALNLSLKRSRDVNGTETNMHERNVLRHSDLHSAFSRYSASATNQTSIGSAHKSEASKTESILNFISDQEGTTPPNQRSCGNSNECDMGSFSDKSALRSAVDPKCLHQSSALKPVQNSHISLSFQPVPQHESDAATATTILTQVRSINQEVQIQHHHLHYHHHHHHHTQNAPHQRADSNDDMSLKYMEAAAPQCGSSNAVRSPIKGNIRNHSLYRSSSGSNHGSNGQHGSIPFLDVRGMNTESNDEVVIKGAAFDETGNRSSSGADSNRSAQREAALNKFRQKRKERCFEKKVRYHSRKKLAEQRPRVRGQFVRRAANQNQDKDNNS